MPAIAPRPDAIAPPRRDGASVLRNLESFLDRYRLELAWAAFVSVNYVAMFAWPKWQTVPFYLVWISLTLVYGLRVWPLRPTLIVLVVAIVLTGIPTAMHVMGGADAVQKLVKVPLMAMLFVAVVWHARRRVEALRIAERRAEELRSTLERQERFVHDASHELRTPLTIARGHLELLAEDPDASNAEAPPSGAADHSTKAPPSGAADHSTKAPPSVAADHSMVAIALEELSRIDAIVGRLLLLASAAQPDFLQTEEVDLEAFLEDIFMRWSEVAPRAWRLGTLTPGRLLVDPDRLRAALDALVENAVKFTHEHDAIELRALSDGSRRIVIEVVDEGCGVHPEALERIFDRFARADAARTRSAGGVGLGLAIVDAIAKRHGGRCTVRSTDSGSTFALSLPGFTPAGDAAAPGAAASGRTEEPTSGAVAQRPAPATSASA